MSKRFARYENVPIPAQFINEKGEIKIEDLKKLFPEHEFYESKIIIDERKCQNDPSKIS